LVGEGVVSRVDSDWVATGTTAVVDSSGVVVALSVALVTADSAVPELVDEAETEEPVDEMPEAEPVELTEEASESDDAALVADAPPVAEDCTADVTSPDPSVLLGLVAIGTMGIMVLSLEVVAGSLELPEAMVDGLSVG
jgi:hypothetical protein